MVDHEPILTDSREMAQLLLNARERGDAFGELLTDYTQYLRWIARNCLDDRIRHRVSEADVVQETFANAIRSFDDFRGTSSAEFAAWLRRILINCVARQTERHLMTAGRDARREVSLQTMQLRADESTFAMAEILTAGDDSPSSTLETHEQIRDLICVIDQLPADQRDCIKLRHLDGLRFREVGLKLNCTETAARMRYSRAINNLSTGSVAARKHVT